MLTTLIKELEGTNSKLFMLKGGKRCPLSDCEFRIRIYEDKREIPTLGGVAQSRSYRAALAICSDINSKIDVRDIDRGYFEIQTDIETGYNEHKSILLDQIAAVDLNGIGEWTFEIIDTEMIKRLLSL